MDTHAYIKHPKLDIHHVWYPERGAKLHSELGRD